MNTKTKTSVKHQPGSSGEVVLVGSACTLLAMLAQWPLMGHATAQPKALVCLDEQTPELQAHSIPIQPNLRTILEQRSQPDAITVLLSLPLAQIDVINKLTKDLDHAGVIWRYLPTLEDQLAGRINPLELLQGNETRTKTHNIKPAGALTLTTTPRPQRVPVESGRSPLWSIDPEALLDRKPHPLDETSIRELVTGKVVLITGSGGSIGSELARTVCRFEPSRIVLVERAENALFEIDRDLARRYPAIARSTVLHDVTDAPRTLGVLTAHKPHVIFHAAAHKHVPMMEEHPSAAVGEQFLWDAIHRRCCLQGGCWPVCDDLQ
ncbi:MAG: polysaccharide biosynthesis protein [Phycisphaerales bacterium]|nr:polysaccharide biosynthesis protein [Phycisphaerales bacterium]